MKTTCASNANIRDVVLNVVVFYLKTCDGDGDWCNACIGKSSQTDRATVYRSLKDTLEEHVLDGNDDETSIEFFLHSNDTEMR